jgi:hypothetical protein
VPMADWTPVSDPPCDRPLWLCAIHEGGTHCLQFPCRWTGSGWVNAVTNSSVKFEPTHWQDWSQRRFDVEHEGRIRAIQMLLGAELTALYDAFLQQSIPPEISRLLDELAEGELRQLDQPPGRSYRASSPN